MPESSRMSALQVGTTVLATLALGVSILARGDVASISGQFVGTGANVGLSLTVNAGTASVLAVVATECAGTGGQVNYVHCNIPYPREQESGSGFLIHRIVYDQGNAPSLAIFNVQFAVDGVSSGNYVNLQVGNKGLRNFTGSTGTTLAITATGAWIWNVDDVIRAYTTSSDTGLPITQHQARMTVYYSDRREGDAQ